MDIELTRIDTVFAWHARLFFLFLITYPFIFGARRIHEYRLRIPLQGAAISETFLSLFVALTVTHISCFYLARSIHLFGGGTAPRAAGAAEAQLPLFIGAAETIVLGLLVAALSRRRDVVSSDMALPRAATFAYSAFTLLLVVGEVFLCTFVVGSQRSSAFVLPSIGLATMSAVGIAATIFASVRWRHATASVSQLFVAIAVVATSAGVAWVEIRTFQHIALGR